MIAELVQQAKRRSVSGREPFKQRPIHWLIELDAEGSVLGFTATTRSTTDAKGLKEERGKRFQVPSNYMLGSSNDSKWLPDFLSGPVAEIFPAGVDGVSIFRLRDVVAARRSGGKRFPDSNRLWKLGQWRRLIFRCERAFPQNSTIKSVANFIRDPNRLRFDVLTLPATGEALEKLLDGFRDGILTISFRVDGVLAMRDPDLSRWWQKIEFPRLYAAATAKFDQLGVDAFQDGEGRLTNSSPCVFGNVPLASFNGAPFSSYGLGDETLRIRLDTAEQAAAALNALQNDPNHHLSLGDQTAIFWATHREKAVDCSFVSLLEESDPLAVADFLKSVWGPVPGEINQATFQVAILEAGTGRFALRSWDSCVLGDVDRRYRAYFEAIRLPGANPTRLGALAAATIAKSKKGSKTKPASTTYNAIFQTAWSGTRLPYRLLEAAVTRQCVELAKGCDKKDRNDFEDRLRARTALIKLHFHSNHIDPDHPMNESTHDTQDHPAYLCGRVLALLDRIHNEAHGGSTASSPADRYYSSASSTPALVFPRLCKLTRIHLASIRKSSKRGWLAPLLDADLSRIVEKFNQGAKWPRTLSLEEQGRFAIGFYYERSPKADTPEGESGDTPSKS